MNPQEPVPEKLICLPAFVVAILFALELVFSRDANKNDFVHIILFGLTLLVVVLGLPISIMFDTFRLYAGIVAFLASLTSLAAASEIPDIQTVHIAFAHSRDQDRAPETAPTVPEEFTPDFMVSDGYRPGNATLRVFNTVAPLVYLILYLAYVSIRNIVEYKRNRVSPTESV